YTDDLILGLRIIGLGGSTEGFANGVGVCEKAANKGLVDERNLGRRFGITGVEITASQQRNLQRFEIAGADPGEPRPVVHGAGADAVREHASTDQDVGGSGGSLDLRDGADVIKQLSLKGFDLAWGESEAAHVEEGEQNPFLAEAKIHGHQISKAPHEQQRSHDEHQGNRDLHHDKEALERKALAGGGKAAPSGLDGGARFDM